MPILSMPYKTVIAVIIFASRLVAQPAVVHEVQVGPSDWPQVEVHIAAHPRNADNLLMSVIGFSRDDTSHRNARAAATTFHSLDGGKTWSESPIPEQAARGGYNARVLFTPDGTAWFTAITFKPHQGLLWRSHDGGHSWGAAQHYGRGGDYPTLAIAGPGRVLVAATNNSGFPPERSLLNLWTPNSNETPPPQAPTIGARSDPATTDAWGLLNMNAVSFRDGAILLPYLDMPNGGDNWWQAHVLVDSSGRRKSPQRRSLPVVYGAFKKAEDGEVVPRGGFNGFNIAYAVSPASDRLFAVWGDRATLPARIKIASSADQGATWTKPLEIASSPGSGFQYQSAVAVNKDGVVGVTWFDTCEHPGHTAYDVHFAASYDEGRTFTAPIRINSASSKPVAWNKGGFDSERHVVGGDYVGLVADAGGDFHAAWPDARNGLFQVWTAKVNVPRRTLERAASTPGEIASQEVALRETNQDAPAPPVAPAIGYSAIDVTSHLERLNTARQRDVALARQLFADGMNLGRRQRALMLAALEEPGLLNLPAGKQAQAVAAVAAFGRTFFLATVSGETVALISVDEAGVPTACHLPEQQAKPRQLTFADNALWVLAEAPEGPLNRAWIVYHSEDGVAWTTASRFRTSANVSGFAVRQNSLYLRLSDLDSSILFVAARHYTVRAVLAPEKTLVLPDGSTDKNGNSGTLAEIGMPQGARAFRHQTVFHPKTFPSLASPILITGFAYRPEPHPRANAPYENKVGSVDYWLSAIRLPEAMDLSLEYTANRPAYLPKVYGGSLAWKTDLSGGFDAHVKLDSPYLYDPTIGALLIEAAVPIGSDKQVYFDAVRGPGYGVSRSIGGLTEPKADSVDYSAPVLQLTYVPQPQLPLAPLVRLASPVAKRGEALLLEPKTDAKIIWSRWRKLSGPGVATFINSSALSTHVQFDQVGRHILRLEVSDGLKTSATDFAFSVE